MKVLVVGNGAREHAIAAKIAGSPLDPEVLIAPGNAGTAEIGTNVDVGAEDIEGVLAFAKDASVDLTIVGPEAPLAAGIVDIFESEDLTIFGPTQAAARIESSKAFAKEVMASADVPTAKVDVFTDIGQALIHLEQSEPPFVIKADGLAAGKGVLMAPTMSDGIDALNAILVDRAFGSAGDKVLIEEWLEGPELSVFAFVDGEYVSPMTAACDYKRSEDGDQGLNTGGMGSYSPPSFWDAELEQLVRTRIMEPVAAQLNTLGCPYRGTLYGGLMLTSDGPKVIEFNCRLGDPETQVVLPRLETDLLEIIVASVEGRLRSQEIEWSPDPWVGVVLASGGYPESYGTGFEVTGLPEPSGDTAVFHAGTKSDGASTVVTSGGRVLTAAARGTSLADARDKAYKLAKQISFDNVYYRTDIALNV